jgi:hypothetical protein
MKVLFCGNCTDIRAMDPTGAWTACRCGQMQARWEDAQRGLVRVKAELPDLVRIIGMNNGFLRAAFQLQAKSPQLTVDEYWQHKHRIECAEIPDTHLFHNNHRGCWACIIRVGETGDVKWEPVEDVE